MSVSTRSFPTERSDARRSDRAWTIRRQALRSLLWKEWREQRPILLSGLGLLALIPVMIGLAARAVEHTGSLQAAAELTARTAPFVLWPLFALAAGAVAIAGDVGAAGRLGYLLSRPVSRTTVWGCKVVAASLTLGVIVLATDLLGRSLAAADGSPAFSLLRWADGVPRASADAHLLFMALPAIAVLFLACAIFWSTWFPRPLTVVFAGGLSSLFLYAAILGVWWNLDIYPRLTAARMAWGPLAAALPLLLGSAWAFHHGGMLRGHTRSTLRAGLTALGSIALILGLSAAIDARPPGATARYRELHASPDGRLLVTAVRPDGASRTVWISDTDARRFVSATSRLSEHAVSSPDGSLIAYASSRGALGRKARSAQIRVMRPDGSEDRAVLEGLLTPSVNFGINGNSRASARLHALVFSADRRWLAVQQAETLYSLDLETGHTTRRLLDRGCLVLGWSAGATRTIVHCPYGPPRLLAVTPSTDQPPLRTELFDFRRPRLSTLASSALHQLPFAHVRRGDNSVASLLRIYLAMPGAEPDRRFEQEQPDRDWLAGTGLGMDAFAWTTVSRDGRESVVWAGVGENEPRAVTRITGRATVLGIDPGDRWAVVLQEHGSRYEPGRYELAAISLSDGRRIVLDTDSEQRWGWSQPVWPAPDRVAFLQNRGPPAAVYGGRALSRATSVRVHDLPTGEVWAVEPLR